MILNHQCVILDCPTDWFSVVLGVDDKSTEER